MIKGANKYYYSKDGLGSVVNLTDSQGTITESYTYDEYGNLTSAPSQVGNRYLYTGREYDPETGLYYYRARYYDPSIGKFLQTDPVGYSGGINLYTYVGNNPVNFVDPWGLYWFIQSWQTPGFVGHPDTLVPPGGPVSEFIETYVPAGYTFGEMHDAFVGAAEIAGFPNWLVNIPSMLPMYRAAQIVEVLRSLGILDQPKPTAKPALCK